MVTCTTPPFRAAVRLNSGVRRHYANGDDHLKAIVIPLIVIVLMLIAALPLAIFKHTTKIGLVLRLCAGLICLGAWLKFGAQFDRPGGKAGAFMAHFCNRLLLRFCHAMSQAKGITNC